MSISRELPIDPNDVERLYREVGCALWLTQALEDSIAHVITITLKVSREFGIEEAESILNSTRKNTLGKLFREVREFGELPVDIEARFSRFLGERNWLVHNCWRLHHTDIYHPERFDKLLIRIEGAGEEARDLNSEFVNILEKYVVERSVKPERMVELANSTLDKWIEGDEQAEPQYED